MTEVPTKVTTISVRWCTLSSHLNSLWPEVMLWGVGQGLLNITVDDLYKLHVEKLGHQEINCQLVQRVQMLPSVQEVVTHFM